MHRSYDQRTMKTTASPLIHASQALDGLDAEDLSADQRRELADLAARIGRILSHGTNQAPAMVELADAYERLRFHAVTTDTGHLAKGRVDRRLHKLAQTINAYLARQATSTP